MQLVASQELSEYEIERGKPSPSKLQSLLTVRILFYLEEHYSKIYSIYPNLDLDTPGKISVPFVSICTVEKAPIDFSKDELVQKDPPLATIEIIHPTQVLQTLIDKTNDYFSFGVKSCWIVLPTLKSIYVFSAPHQFEVFSTGDELHDPNLDIRIPMDTLFAA
jgi:hypothetical protein